MVGRLLPGSLARLDSLEVVCGACTPAVGTAATDPTGLTDFPFLLCKTRTVFPI